MLRSEFAPVFKSAHLLKDLRIVRAMAEAAGFTRFRKLDIDHAINAFYEIRP